MNETAFEFRANFYTYGSDRDGPASGWPWPLGALFVDGLHEGRPFGTLVLEGWVQTRDSLLLGDRAGLPGLGRVAADASDDRSPPPPGGAARLWREGARLAAAHFGSAVERPRRLAPAWAEGWEEAAAQGGELLAEGGAAFWCHGSGEPRGLFAAVRPHPLEAEDLARQLGGAARAEDLHGTLAYFAKCPPGDPRVSAVARAVGDLPRWGAGGGVRVPVLGVERVPSAEGHIFQLLLDPALPTRWRQGVLDRLPAAQARPDRTHAFRPHVTLAKLPPDAPTPALSPPSHLTFDSVWCCLGRRGVAFPL